jgi:HK97 family phage prohead protease
MPNFVSQREFHEIAGRGDAADIGVSLPARAVRANEDSRTVRFVLSDESIDRMGDVLAVDGWELSAYRRNPTVLWAHLSSEPPIGKMTNIFVSGDRLIGDVKFADAETYDFADQIFRLVKKGYITAGSVGFIPLDFTFSDERRGGIDFRRQELLEFSVVPVPANANSLVVQAVKSVARRGSALVRQSAPAPSTMDYAGTFQQRKAQLDWAHPELSDHARTKAQIKTLLAIGPPDTTARRRVWIMKLRALYERTSR